jgi:hypothetical protein
VAFRDRVRDRAARAATRIASRKGTECDFINPGVAAVTLKCFIDENSQEAGLRGGVTDRFKYTFVVPRQTGFPPVAVAPGATIRYPKTTGTEYQIDLMTPDNEDLLMAATFRLDCGRFGETVEI